MPVEASGVGGPVADCPHGLESLVRSGDVCVIVVMKGAAGGEGFGEELLG